MSGRDERIQALLIERPSWARAPQIDIEDNDTKSAYQEIQSRWSEIGPLLHNRIEQFFNDPDQTYSHEEDGFPCRQRLTGEYYIGDAWCKRQEFRSRPACYCAVMFRCLESSSMPNRDDRDYLGLEAGICLWLDTHEIELDEGFNTSVI